MLSDPDLASDTGFAEWAKLETRQGTVDSVKVLSQTGDDSRVTVECEVIYADGTTKARTVSLTLEDGKWRLGLLG